jgi:hypothetical protein
MALKKVRSGDRPFHTSASIGTAEVVVDYASPNV